MTYQTELITERLRFSVWNEADLDLARLLWGDPDVTRYICASGVFSPEDIEKRLAAEVNNLRKYKVQYWPVFDRENDELAGCCGLRPYSENVYEIGFHLRPQYQRQGYAREAAKAVIEYAFNTLKAEALFAGHNPKNTASAKVLAKLGFQYIRDEFYEPTGLFHPSYELKNINCRRKSV